MTKHNIIKHFYLSLFAGVLVSCSGNGSPYFADIDNDYYLRVSPSTISLEGEESATFTITSNVNSWEITGIPDWLILSSISGKGNATITVYAKANTTGKDRTAFLTVKSSESSVNDVTVSIDQKKKVFSISPSYLDFEAVGGKNTLTITSSQSWTISYTASWLSVDKESGTGDDNVVVTVEENVTTQAREADMTIKSGTESIIVKIYQKGSNIVFSVSPTDLSFETAGGKNTLTITSSQSWTISYTASWLSVDKESGTGDDNVVVTVEENVTTQAREADMTIKSGTESIIVKIYQKGLEGEKPGDGDNQPPVAPTRENR